MSDEIKNRVVMIGSTEVGKTSLVSSFTRNHFEPEIKSTVGAVFHIYEEEFEGKKYTMQIWDTAGQEKYRSLGPIYYRDASAAIAVFDVTNQESMDELPSWIENFQATTTNSHIFIAGNKIDLDKPKISSETIAQFSQKYDATWFETSAKTGENVNELFDAVFKTLIHDLKPQFDPKSVVSDDINEKNQHNCC